MRGTTTALIAFTTQYVQLCRENDYGFPTYPPLHDISWQTEDLDMDQHQLRKQQFVRSSSARVVRCHEHGPEPLFLSLKTTRGLCLASEAHLSTAEQYREECQEQGYGVGQAARSDV